MKRFHLYLVSDSTGETLKAVSQAALVQFEAIECVEHPYALVRSEVQLERILADIQAAPGAVLYTLVSDELRGQLEAGCMRMGVPALPILDPVIAMLGSHFGAPVRKRLSGQHELNANYFSRIEAMHFTMSHDDGQLLSELHEADVVLVGVSRTSKTPTSIYLANRGLKTANVPMVPNMALPRELERLKGPLIVGLTTNPERLVQVRRNRLLTLRQTGDTEYVELDLVKEEVTQARRTFVRMGWPIIDVTRRSIEETAAAILNLLSRRPEN